LVAGFQVAGSVKSARPLTPPVPMYTFLSTTSGSLAGKSMFGMSSVALPMYKPVNPGGMSGCTDCGVSQFNPDALMMMPLEPIMQRGSEMPWGNSSDTRPSASTDRSIWSSRIAT
jgi:hypothetical protein